MEDEREIPEWEEPQKEEVPPALRKKWLDDKKRGLRAGVCPSCGWPFLEEELSCRHCEKPLEVESGVISSLAAWLFKTPWGVVTFLLILLAVILFLV